MLKRRYKFRSLLPRVGILLIEVPKMRKVHEIKGISNYYLKNRYIKIKQIKYFQ